mmetsp:Transcript_34285/g.83176  ORF Transcript_34285/g.83176 Transcript_34285/m.83176 type:complete len:143 (+) Transcript_34285:709-1137(+)
MEDAYPVLPGAMYTGDPVIVANPSHLKHALSLADYVITDEQKEVLKNETSTRQQVMDTAMEIGFEAFKKLYELEGTTPEVAMKEKGGRAKMNYTGMGNRVKVYKQWMVEKMYPDTFLKHIRVNVSWKSNFWKETRLLPQLKG